MKFLPSNGVCRLNAVSRRVVLAGLMAAVGTGAHAVTYDESVRGDLSSDPGHPTDIGTLSPGTSSVIGATVPSGPIVDPSTGARAVEDNDYASFTVPVGEVLSQLFLGSGSAFEPGDRMFFGIAQGAGVHVDPSFTSAAGLLGWTLVGSPAVGTDVLPALGLSAPTMFPHIGGATGFTGSLGAGTYTLWMVDGDRPAAYSLDLVTAAVPEPASWMTMFAGFGLLGVALRGRAPGRPRDAT